MGHFVRIGFGNKKIAARLEKSVRTVRRAQSQPAAGADDAGAVIRLRTTPGRKYPAKFSPWERASRVPPPRHL
jgi:hypothetical protein